MNFSSKKLTINAISTVFQVGFTGVLYFFLYKYLLENIGAEQLGIWSLILSFSSIANLANLGFTSGLVKFVAEYLIGDDRTKIGKLIFTSTISMITLFSLLSVIIILFAEIILPYVVDENFINIAMNILPYSLASLTINAVGGIFTSVLEGHQKNYIRNYIFIISGIVMLILVLFLTPEYNIIGVAIAQLIQSLFILISAIIFTLKLSQDNNIVNWKWSSQSFKELFNYGYKFQAISIAQLLCEPTTKILLSKFGGLAFVGHYEMASKAVNQFRALLVNTNQVVVPVIVQNYKIKTRAQTQEFYQKMNKVLLLITVPLSSLFMLAIPLISIIWIGSFNYDFSLSMLILIASNLINILCGPAYFSCLAEGRLTILLSIHIGMALINLILGYLLGNSFYGYGVVLAWGISIAVSSIILIYSYGSKIKISYIKIFSWNYKLQFVLFCLIYVLCIFIFRFLNIYWDETKAILLLLLIFLFLPLILKNEIIKRLINKRQMIKK
ncbi:oligosaccharide flippase family protein [Chryseobacterium binzhouense]|uniref:oligosaccharide flippase family protein n=1 Tax=Chryseobacterium binzhouense TaxID=2593646 RepID=UPI001180890B|nr:oligosaccharide flippase family protein [Chryseobacterium binzhouense]